MNALAGEAALVFAWAMALATVVGSVLPRIVRPAVVRGAMVASCVGSILSAVVLGWALVTSDFSLSYVADYSRRAAPSPIRFAGLWGGIGGSLLLWVCGSGIAGLWLVRRMRAESADVTVRAMGFLAVPMVASLSAARWLANPFRTRPIPALDGGGLTPILEHPAMTFHPPLLYAGLVAFGPPAAFATAHRLVGSLGEAEVAMVRRWTTAALAVTTLGLLTGANWAYVELGWGGYWAWDPVENAGLVPWLCGLAFVHAALPSRSGAHRTHPDRLGRLAAVPFLAVLGASALVRSGATLSVHSFAEQRAIGWVLGAGCAVAAAIALWPTPVRHRPSASSSLRDAPLGGVQTTRWRRRGAKRSAPQRTPPVGAAWAPFWVATIAASLAALLALWVTAALAAPVVVASASSINGRFHASLAGPVAGVAAVLAGLVGSSSGAAGRRRLAGGTAGALVGVAAVAVAGWPWWPTGSLTAAGCLGAGAGLAGLARRGLASTLAHLGFALFVVGVAGTTAGADRTAPLMVGESMRVDEFTITNQGVHVRAGASESVRVVVADLDVEHNGRQVGRLRPELVAYQDRARLLAELAHRSTIGGDLLIALEKASNDGTVILTIRTRPLAAFVWFGALIMACGMALAVGRPGSKRTPAPSARSDGAQTGDGRMPMTPSRA